MTTTQPTSDQPTSDQPTADQPTAHLTADEHLTASRPPVRPDSPTFAQLGARAETVAALEAIGITHAFAIQEYALPIALRGADLIGQAPTGTGKTLGFGIPLLERVTAPAEGATGKPQALVVVPTRELGLQVAKDIAAAGATRGVRVLPVYGGVAYEPQVEALTKGVEVIVGTPGRLLDLCRPAKGHKNPHLRLDTVTALVLDEADRMLDLGFLDDVEKILAMLPEQRQTMLFSATMPDPIVTLARRFLHQPVTVHARHDFAASPLTKQVVYRTHPLNKVEVVARILQSAGRGLTMIFTRTKRAADRAAADLDARGFAVAAVHGDLGQGARERALRAFRSGKIDVLVATDVAARGLDVSGVTHVINYDCPEDPDTYTHRIGRTGRAGATGVAVTFVDWEDMPRWRIIDKTLGLEMPEPPETYHTSPHLFTDLDIDPSVTGTLPRAGRTRAGLSAEIEEDLGGPRSRRAEPDSGRGRRRGSSGGDTAVVEDDAPARAPHTRRRRRGGLTVREGASATVDSVEARPADGVEAPVEARTRTRSKAPTRTTTTRTLAAGTPVTGTPVTDTETALTAAAGTAIDAPAAAPRTRSRTRSGRPTTPPPAAIFSEAASAPAPAPASVTPAGDAPAEAEAPARRPRRRRPATDAA